MFIKLLVFCHWGLGHSYTFQYSKTVIQWRNFNLQHDFHQCVDAAAVLTLVWALKSGDKIETTTEREAEKPG